MTIKHWLVAVAIAGVLLLLANVLLLASIGWPESWRPIHKIARSMLRAIFGKLQSNRMSLLRELFIYHVRSGLTVADALKRSALWAAMEASDRVAEGKKLSGVLTRIGFTNVESLTNLVNANKELGQPMSLEVKFEDRIVKFAFKNPIGAGLFFVVTSGGGVGSMPTPECIESHLPKDRKPTEAELRAAWEACEKG